MVRLLTVAVTALATAIFFAATLHVAARWVLGETPVRKAVLVAPIPAAVVVALGLVDAPPVVLAGGTVAADVVAIVLVYDLRVRLAVALAAVHVVVTVALGIALANLRARLVPG